MGEITVEGTFTLLFVGAQAGVLGGLTYVLVRRWIPGSGVWKGLAFGMFGLLAFGFEFIEDAPQDFRLFRPQALSLALFALLFLLYGLALSPIVERFDPYVRSSLRPRATTASGYVVVAILCVLGVALLVRALGDIL